MKRIVTLLVLAAVCCGTTPLWAAGPRRIEKAQEQLREISRAYDEQSLTVNHLLWRYFIDRREQLGTEIPAKLFSPYSVKTLCDTVPQLKPYGEAYRAADTRYSEVLGTDPEYADIHREYVSLKGVADVKLQNANKQLYNLLYSRLRKTIPETYMPALDSLNAAARRRNFAAARYLLDRAEITGTEMPPLTAYEFAADRSAILRTHPELSEMEARAAVLKKMRDELRERVLREIYGVPEEPKKDRKSGLRTGTTAQDAD